MTLPRRLSFPLATCVYSPKSAARCVRLFQDMILLPLELVFQRAGARSTGKGQGTTAWEKLYHVGGYVPLKVDTNVANDNDSLPHLELKWSRRYVNIERRGPSPGV